MDTNIDKHDYLENDFYRNVNGTTAWETFSMIYPTFLLTFIATTVSSLFIGNSSKSTCYHFLIDFIIIIVPMILSFTILDEYTIHYTLFLTIISVLIFLYYYLKRSHKKAYPQKSTEHKIYFLTNIRALISILTCIAILAVDFKIFPRRFAKTETFGYSLMDVGVGLFVLSNGVVSAEVRNKQPTLLKSFIGTIPLWILGVGRFLVTQETDYYVPVSEYGVHWNFFITLAITRLISSVLLRFISIRKSFVLSVILLMIHETCIQAGLGKWVLEVSPRNTFIQANREGISASLGYVALYFISVHMGKIILTPNSKNVFRKLFLSSCAALVIHLMFSRYFGVSRRLANTGYCTWVVFITIFMSFLFMLAEKISYYLYEITGQRNKIYIPLIFDAANYNGLVYFLLSNIVTGLINMSIKTKNVNSVNSMFILILYKFITCFIISYLYAKKIKLKIW